MITTDTPTRAFLRENAERVLSFVNYEEYVYKGNTYVAGWRHFSRGKFSGWEVHEKGTVTPTTLVFTLDARLTGDEENTVMEVLQDALQDYQEKRRDVYAFVTQKKPSMSDYTRDVKMEREHFKVMLAGKLKLAADKLRIKQG